MKPECKQPLTKHKKRIHEVLFFPQGCFAISHQILTDESKRLRSSINAQQLKAGGVESEVEGSQLGIIWEE